MSIAQLEAALQDTRIIELGQYLEERMPSHPSHSKFYKTLWHGFQNGDSCLDYQLILNEHNGTHVDSFGHYINKPGYELIDEILPASLCGPCVTIDATFLKDRETLEEQHIVAWEKERGQEIQAGEIVLLDFGWMRHWALRPNEGHFVANYPGLGGKGAEYLVQRGVKMVGVDTLSVDADKALGDPAHNALLSNRVAVVENLRNLEKLHDKRAFFVVLPLLIRGGSASPVRPIAIIDA
jgi:kynurenine formamidase